MRKPVRIILVILLVIMTIGLVWTGLRRQEPVYQSKRLGVWLTDFENWDGDTNSAASVAVRAMGTNAVPLLLNIMQSGLSPIQRTIIRLNRKQSIIDIPFGKPGHRTLAAAYAICVMGTNARPALPALTNLFFQSNEKIPSAIALAGIGPEAVPTLIAALTNQNAAMQTAAILGLGYEHYELNIVVPALIARLNDKIGEIQNEAAIALGQLHAEPEIAVPALIKNFPGNDPLHRMLILVSLGLFGSKAGESVPMLLDALKDNDQDVRNAAASALKEVDPEAAARAGVK